MDERPVTPPGQQIVGPITFCATQVNALAARIHDLEKAIDALHETRIADVEAGVTNVLLRVTNDPKVGAPHWHAGADHIGQRWSERASNWVGATMIRLVGGGLLIALVTWYFATDGGKK
jgi:hypothetical protein